MMENLKGILLLILVLLSSLVHSQYNYQIVDTTKTWNTLQIGYGSFMVTYCGGTRTNVFHDEEVIGGNTFLDVWESYDSLNNLWDQVGLIREDSATGQVFFKGYGEPGLLYDFNLQIGDSVVIDNDYFRAYDIHYTCVDIDTIEINGMQKRRFFMHSEGYGPYISDVWTEGIGSIWGPLNSGFGAAGAAGGGYTLLCCKQNDTLLYMDTTYNSCYISDFYPKIASDHFDTAYVGQPYYFQVLLSDTSGIDSIGFVGGYIPDDFLFDESTGVLTGNPSTPGSYPCLILVVNYDNNLITDILEDYIPVVLPVEVNHSLDPFDIKIYPNPFDRTLNITSSLYKEAMCTLEIINSSGLVLEKRNIGKGLTKLDFSQYSSGIFLLRFTSPRTAMFKIDKVVKK
jgi:hypothetical protein